jgi:hypothetical protein
MILGFFVRSARRSDQPVNVAPGWSGGPGAPGGPGGFGTGPTF